MGVGGGIGGEGLFAILWKPPPVLGRLSCELRGVDGGVGWGGRWGLPSCGACVQRRVMGM